MIMNIAAGVILIWDGSFKKNDVISIDGGGYGWIEKLTLRHAVIKDRNDVSTLVPYRSLIERRIQNWSHDRNMVRLKIDIGIAYESDDTIAKEAILRAAMKANPRVLKEPPPKVMTMDAGDSAIRMQLRFWIADPKGGIRNVMSDILEMMIKELKASGVSIPFNTIDVHLKDLPEPLLGKMKQVAS